MGSCLTRPGDWNESIEADDGTPAQPICCAEMMDWDDERLMSHKCAMNCLHNYAIGKMRIEEESSDKLTHSPCTQCTSPSPKSSSRGGSKLLTVNSCERKKSGQFQNISFAKDLEQIRVFESEQLSCPNLVVPERACKDECHITSDSIAGGSNSLMANYETSLTESELLSDPDKAPSARQSCPPDFPFPGGGLECLYDLVRFPEIE